MFASLYARVIQWAGHRHAPWYLAMLSFAEASFFPVPPDVMLVPMTLARRRRAWRYAAIATCASALGGMAGYALGMLAFDVVGPLLREAGYWPAYLQARDWFDQWGVLVVFIAGFSPIPYKVFTITAGAVAMAFPPFVIASVIGRGARFFLVSALIYSGGERMDRFLRRYIDRLGWGVVGVAVMAYLILR
ncbi:MAG TPA: DedA family protein [Gammaproteobacteria bacterium]|nr:DedA family protein [Gammaproteobacteria bacterium]